MIRENEIKCFRQLIDYLNFRIGKTSTEMKKEKNKQQNVPHHTQSQ